MTSVLEKHDLFTEFKHMICDIFTLKCLKITLTVIYFAELCFHVIPNISNNVQTQRKSVLLFKLILHFILLPIVNFGGNNGQRVRR